jgi:hypothetical protein
MNCHEAGRHLPGYLDGAIEVQAQAGLRRHLEFCDDCRSEAERYRLMSLTLANLEPIPAPPDLALRIRIQASKASPWGVLSRHARARLGLVFQNILAPLALPATGGVLTALGVFVLILQSMLVGVPLGSVADDQPLNLVQPATLESLGPLPAPAFEVDEHGNPGGLTVDTTVNAQGRAVDYRIISGPSDSGVTRQMDQVMLLSRFRPLLTDGRPTNGGHVVLNFSAIRVRG